MLYRVRRFKRAIRPVSTFLIAVIFAVLAAASPARAATDTFTDPGSGTWVAPEGVTSITVECWGAGGGGGDDTVVSSGGGGGGGGGAYARVESFPVTPGVSYSFQVGTGGSAAAPGGSSSFNTDTCIAAGGGGGSSANGGAGGAGGSASSPTTGDVTYAGGNGSAGISSFGGGGGGSAGPSSNGNSVTNSGTGAAAVADGGPGGNGGTNNNGSAPAAGPGGGGGGGEYSNSTGAKTGGAGFAGQIRITYKATPTLAVSGPAATYDGTQQQATVVGSVPGTVSNVLYDGSPVAPTDAGTYVITADFTPDNTTDYNSLSGAAAGTFTIDRAATTTTITCEAGPFTFSGDALEPCTASVTGTGGLDQVLTITYADNVNAGTAAASASYAGDTNYLPSSDTKNFTIDQAATTTTVICGAGPFTYSGDALAPCTATVTGPGGLNQVLTVSYADNIDAGTAAASASYAGDANYLPSSDTANFTIDKAIPVLSVTNSPVAYDGTPKLATVEGSVPGTVTNIRYNGSADAPTDAGTYAITADFTPDNTTNYNSLTDASAGTFVIEKAGTPTLAVTNSPVTYNGVPQEATVVGSVPGTVSNVLYNGSPAVPADAGTYVITADFTPDDTTNYDSVSGAAAGSFTIAKAATVTVVTCAAGPFIYSGAAFTPCTAAVTGPGGLNQALTVSYADNLDAGTATATASFVGDANYLPSSDVENFTIEKVTPVLSVTNSPAAYDGTPKTATVVGSAAGTVSNIRYNGSADAPTDAGTYAVTADFTPTDMTNYNTLSGAAAGNFVIEKAGTPTLTVTNSAVTFNGAPQAATVVGSVPGTVSNVLYNGSTVVPTNAGTYVITADFTPADTTNYDTINGAAAGSFTIAKATTTTTLSCAAGPFTYSGAGIVPCTGIVAGAGGLDLALTVTYANNINAGTATASASFAGDANYLPSSDVENFTIGKAPTATVVTCAAGPFTATGAPIEPCTASVTGPGGLNQALAVSYAGNVNAGTATASASFAGSANYLPSSDSETFIIGEAVPPTTSFYLPYISR